MSIVNVVLSPAPNLVSYDYDDVSMWLTAVHVVNTGLYPLPASATVTSNGRTFSHTTAPGDTFNQSIPTGVATRLSNFVNAQGRVDGVDWNIG